MTRADPNAIPFVAGEVKGHDATPFDCPLCGARFTHGTLVCTTCPLNAGCEIVKCPSCGYQFPRQSRLIAWAQRMLRGVRG